MWVEFPKSFTHKFRTENLASASAFSQLSRLFLSLKILFWNEIFKVTKIWKNTGYFAIAYLSWIENRQDCWNWSTGGRVILSRCCEKVEKVEKAKNWLRKGPMSRWESGRRRRPRICMMERKREGERQERRLLYGRVASRKLVRYSCLVSLGGLRDRESTDVFCVEWESSR